MGTLPLDSALRGSWKAEGGETKKEVALEKVKGISGHNQVPWVSDTEGDLLTLSPGTHPESVPCGHV